MPSSPPFIRPLSWKASPLYQARFLKHWYSKMSPSREANHLIKLLFHWKRILLYSSWINFNVKNNNSQFLPLSTCINNPFTPTKKIPGRLIIYEGLQLQDGILFLSSIYLLYIINEVILQLHWGLIIKHAYFQGLADLFTFTLWDF